ncbi:MAG: radical SAM protein [Planctomycetes bacterium]|nr:radical SAM protein [Planctomycetota bacterium]
MPTPVRSRVYRGILETLPAPLSARLLQWRLPRQVYIEPTNHCNLQCPLCFQPDHLRPRGRMTLEQFRALAQELSGFARGLVMHVLGESTLHPDLYSMIACAENLGLRCMLSTNGTLLERQVDAILESRLSVLRVTIEGSDAATHERYRVGSDFESVRRGFERLCAERRRRGLERPWLVVQTLALGFNTEQRGEIRAWALAAGADQHLVRDVHLGLGFAKRPEAELAREFLDEELLRTDPELSGVDPCKVDRICSELYRATILWNGDVVPCARGAWNGTGAFGNALRDGGFKRVWRSRAHLEYLVRHATHGPAGCGTLRTERAVAP